MGSLPDREYSPSTHHLGLLQQAYGGNFAPKSLVRSYKRSFNGFAALLSDKEREKLASLEGVESVFPSRELQLQTTRSWDFMGFSKNVKRNHMTESNVIIGVIDTGIWPESPSFNDNGFGPPPRKWKGACEGGRNFTCNNKIIGARHYNTNPDPALKSSKVDSARDTLGHGTHTASTAAGNAVDGASFYGLAQGTARGGVPSARIAAYKVCGPTSCYEDDILAAFDDAIADGVDILTVSIGGSDPVEMFKDAVAIGAFHAMEKGILTFNAAGNSGPDLATTTSVAPWMLSVAASSTDRHMISRVVLGNRASLTGIAINSFGLMKRMMFPLVYGKDATSNCSEEGARLCMEGCLDNRLVKGKIVVCDGVMGVAEAIRAGALGSIALGDDFVEDVAQNFPLPASVLNEQNYNLLLSYYNSTSKPQAYILKSEATIDPSAPLVVSFSSRGPNRIIPQILKPDISAPGVDILAAYSPFAPPSNYLNDKRSTLYNMVSGTSMACPHVAGAAAYLKSLHPRWSPSAIKSALMTTAWTMNSTTNKDGELSYGAGHINPIKAADPGLVYEAFRDDYIKMLCDMGYDMKMIRTITGDMSSCPKGHKGSPKDLNYPSMASQVDEYKSFTLRFPRTVTNVGRANSTYKAKVTMADSKIRVGVRPSVLSFEALYEKKSFVVTVVSPPGEGVHGLMSGSLVWSDGTHVVRSPIVAYTPIRTSV
ncbi:subtilisin-like protease SBT4.5 [Cornus florida]|uniref:subtilisin-like protease SBT4.5 n=1 Tax=Cornus florida TaxID=4283 RepID=UPI0028A09B46|nr:subtilisin-like protease SBT4.5 [Cornus florida]